MIVLTIYIMPGFVKLISVPEYNSILLHFTNIAEQAELRFRYTRRKVTIKSDDKK